MELHRTDEGFALYKEKSTDRLLRAHARRKGGCHHRVWHRTAVAAQRLRLLSIKRNFARLRRIRPRKGYRIYRPAARRCRRACVLGKVRLCGRRQAAGTPPHAGPDRRQVRAGLSGRTAGTAAPLHRCYLRQRRRHGLPVRHHRAGRKGSRL